MSSYTILSGSEHMDVAAIHKFLKDSYWARDISIELVRKSIEHSLCYGVFLGTGQVGFARLVTDYATFGYLAACTRTLRFGTGITLLPQRNPVYTAKEAANVDWLSGGRLEFGAGVGWAAEVAF